MRMAGDNQCIHRAAMVGEHMDKCRANDDQEKARGRRAMWAGRGWESGGQVSRTHTHAGDAYKHR
jgi:hypothetical protein